MIGVWLYIVIVTITSMGDSGSYLKLAEQMNLVNSICLWGGYEVVFVLIWTASVILPAAYSVNWNGFSITSTTTG